MNYKQFENRKLEHIKFALQEANQAIECNAFDSITLLHEALPDLNFSEINISSFCLGKKVAKPFLISSMTAGHPQSFEINRRLLEACMKLSWAMGVGSQRRELTDKTAGNEWKSLRREYPNVTLFSNLGISQLIGTQLIKIRALIDALEAQALIVHCNPLQEALQLEGTPQFKSCWAVLEKTVQSIGLPVIVKETGCGFSSATLQRLNNLGVAAVDVSGLGGTHWGRIEGSRATADSIVRKAAFVFQNWGISTVQSLRNSLSCSPSFEIWGSGGIRHGLDAAKAFALGAKMVGVAQIILKSALIDTEAVQQVMQTMEYELKVAMFCTGSSILDELKEKICR